MLSPIMIRLYGTITSPYVRRVRIVAAELGLECELLESASDAGQARLREVTPIWKVPVAELDGQHLFDSHTITELLLARAPGGALAPFALSDFAARNVVAVADGALDALINAFYFAREGITPDKAPYLKKQHARAESSLRWLDAHANGPWLTSTKKLGMPEIAVGTALAWMRFRDVYPIARHPRLLEVLDALEERPSFANTQPSG
jgi:glutathione S-transferase